MPSPISIDELVAEIEKLNRPTVSKDDRRFTRREFEEMLKASGKDHTWWKASRTIREAIHAGVIRFAGKKVAHRVTGETVLQPCYEFVQKGKRK